jgi:hypothetical protein
MDAETKAERDSLFEVIEMLVNQSIQQLLHRHYHALTQEHQLTAKIAQTIEQALGGFQTGRFKIAVAVQDFPDKGPGTLENITGADVYLSVALIDEDGQTSKGMLIQSKWDNTLGGRLTEQIFKMKQCSLWSYIWVYYPDRVVCIKTDDYLAGKHAGESVGKQIANGLRCTEGDRGIGRNLNLPITSSLNQMMREIGAKRAVAVEVSQKIQ